MINIIDTFYQFESIYICKEDKKPVTPAQGWTLFDFEILNRVSETCLMLGIDGTTPELL